MKLWKIERTDRWGYDDFDSAVVAAASEVDARNITPDGRPFAGNWSAWAPSPEHVRAEYIGEAKPGMEAGVILASYNAG